MLSREQYRIWYRRFLFAFNCSNARQVPLLHSAYCESWMLIMQFNLYSYSFMCNLNTQRKIRKWAGVKEIQQNSYQQIKTIIIITLTQITLIMRSEKIEVYIYKEKSKAIPLVDRGGLQGYEMLRIPHCLDQRLTVNCEILATCSSTYSPVRTSQEAHSVSIKLSP
jgi:hypothetical protein